MTKKYSPKLYKSPKISIIKSKSESNYENEKQGIDKSQGTSVSNESVDMSEKSSYSEYNMYGMGKLLEMYLEVVNNNESKYEKIVYKLEKVSHKLDSLSKEQIDKRDKLMVIKTELVKEQSSLRNKTKDLLETIAEATYTASQQL